MNIRFDLCEFQGPSKACLNTIRNNFTKRKYSKIFSCYIGERGDVHSFIVVILFLTLKLVKQHATKSQTAITQEKFCNILPRLTTVCHQVRITKLPKLEIFRKCVHDLD